VSASDNSDMRTNNAFFHMTVPFFKEVEPAEERYEPRQGSVTTEAAAIGGARILL